jgi:hypothetical protein
MKINSVSLAEASTLASEIEALQGKLDMLNGQASDVSKQLEPLQVRFQKLVGSMTGKGGKVVRCARRSKITPEQRAAISAGLKAKWAERKAAKLAALAVPVASV